MSAGLGSSVVAIGGRGGDCIGVPVCTQVRTIATGHRNAQATRDLSGLMSRLLKTASSRDETCPPTVTRKGGNHVTYGS